MLPESTTNDSESFFGSVLPSGLLLMISNQGSADDVLSIGTGVIVVDVAVERLLWNRFGLLPLPIPLPIAAAAAAAAAAAEAAAAAAVAANSSVTSQPAPKN